MSIKLRPFQSDLKSLIYASWDLGLRNVLAVLPTGAGKTVLFSDIVAELKVPTVVTAHRQELVAQISLALARNGVRHKVMAPTAVARVCTNLHLYELNRNYVDPLAHVTVAGVDTLVRRKPHEPWLAAIRLVVQDEAHHILKDNKWGAASAMFPNANTLGVTATPLRADGSGLGAHADGIMHTMIVGPTMRDLINEGWLTEYRIFAPKSDLNLTDVPLSASGDFSPVKLSVAVHKSHIVGDVVAHYKRIADGKLGVTFAVDVASAGELATAYRAAGVPAEVVSAKTPDAARASILRRFRNREILQLVNVDLFGEGFDLPAIEVVSMARPTASFGLYCQQFGRALRLMKGKEYAIIIDHVGNVHRHGLPDARRDWTLDRRDRRSKSDTQSLIPIRVCPSCTAAYERLLSVCPYCNHAVEPASRSSPESVDGDLQELDPTTLARLRESIDAPVSFHPDPIISATLKKRHREKSEAQTELREAMALWGGKHTAHGDTVPMAQRRFFFKYGVDVLSAQALNAREARELTERIRV